MKNVTALLFLPVIVVGYVAGLAWYGIHAGWVNAKIHMDDFWG